MNLLQELLAAAEHPPVAVSLSPRPMQRGCLILVDARGYMCAAIGLDLARQLGWLEDDK